MSRSPFILESVAALRQQVRRWRMAGETVGYVPTMGALHEGHLALVAAVQEKARRCIVSIFVNPAQFAPNEDFSKYPRTFEADVAALMRAGADAVYAPQVAEMYPPGFATSIVPAGPALAGLEDTTRPTHFQGVATVVAKLLLQALPDVAAFGEKDFQQLAVVRAMARDLDLPVTILPVPTVREADGLAMSSRNVYLTASERAAAPVLHRSLREIGAGLRAGKKWLALRADAVSAIEAAGFALDYLELRHTATLAPADGLGNDPLRLLVAARIGSVRLIDNIAV